MYEEIFYVYFLREYFTCLPKTVHLSENTTGANGFLDCSQQKSVWRTEIIDNIVKVLCKLTEVQAMGHLPRWCCHEVCGHIKRGSMVEMHGHLILHKQHIPAYSEVWGHHRYKMLHCLDIS
jgi:hypothetical protein